MNADQIELTPWPAEVAALYRQLGVWQGQTLSEMLAHSCAQHAEREAIICGARRWTYAELAERVAQVAHGLALQGIDAQDKVIVQLPNCAEFFVLCFALFRLGAVPVMALPAHREAEISQFAALSGAKAWVLAWQDGATADLLAKVRASSPSLQRVWLLGGQEHKFSRLYENPPLPDAWPQPDASALALLQLSGGSTGVAKLIPRSHDDYLYSVRRSAEICEIHCASRYLCVLPVAHNFPLSSPGTLGILAQGGCIVLALDASSATAFRLIDQERITLCALVPSLLQLWLQALPQQHPDLSSLEVLQVGGAPLAEALAQRVRAELGCQLQQVFGMAEGLVNYTRLDDSEDICCQTQGRPMSPYDEVRVVDEIDQLLPDGAIGHLQTRGPYTIRGYYQAPQHNAQAFTFDGFYRTGDLVRRLASGHLQVMGRAKEQINRAGEKIAAPEVEAHLLVHPAVLECALLGMEDAVLGERSHAYLVLRQLQQANRQQVAQEFSQFLQRRGLAHYKIPDRFHIVASLPKTAVGKIDKRQLRQQISSIS